MGVSTRLGPWLIGTVKETTGTTAGLVRNIGASTVAQIKTVAFNDVAGTLVGALPAGALVVAASFTTTTTFTAATTIVVSIGAEPINAATTITTGGQYPITLLNTQAVGRVLDVGPVDRLLTYAVAAGASAAGAGKLLVEYVMCSADGTITPAV